MSVMTINLPDNLHEKAREVAASKNLSMDALVTIALTQSLSRLVRDPRWKNAPPARPVKVLASFWRRFRARSRRNGTSCRRIINGNDLLPR